MIQVSFLLKFDDKIHRSTVLNKVFLFLQGTIGSQVNSTEDLPVPSGDKCEHLVVVDINIHPQIGKTMGKMCCSTSQILLGIEIKRIGGVCCT